MKVAALLARKLVPLHGLLWLGACAEPLQLGEIPVMPNLEGRLVAMCRFTLSTSNDLCFAEQRGDDPNRAQAEKPDVAPAEVRTADSATMLEPTLTRDAEGPPASPSAPAGVLPHAHEHSGATGSR